MAHQWGPLNYSPKTMLAERRSRHTRASACTGPAGGSGPRGGGGSWREWLPWNWWRSWLAAGAPSRGAARKAYFRTWTLRMYAAVLGFTIVVLPFTLLLIVSRSASEPHEVGMEVATASPPTPLLQGAGEWARPRGRPL